MARPAHITWTAATKLWAPVESLAHREFTAAAVSEVSARIRLCFRTGAASTIRVVHASEIRNQLGEPHSLKSTHSATDV